MVLKKSPARSPSTWNNSEPCRIKSPVLDTAITTGAPRMLREAIRSKMEAGLGNSAALAVTNSARACFFTLRRTVNRHDC